MLEQLDSPERSPELERERLPSVVDLDSAASRIDERRLQPFERESSTVRDQSSTGLEPLHKATDAWEAERNVVVEVVVVEGGK